MRRSVSAFTAFTAEKNNAVATTIVTVFVVIFAVAVFVVFIIVIAAVVFVSVSKRG
jgi:hypothetical protein